MLNHPVPSTDQNWFKTQPKRKNTRLEISISRNTLVGIIVSLVIHALLLFFYVRTPVQMDMGEPGEQTLSVQLSPLPAPKPQIPVSKPQAETKPAPAKRRTTRKPKTSPPASPPVLAAKSRTAPSIPSPAPETAPVSTAAPTDMSSYINAVRAKRAAESGMPPAEPQPSADDIRMANIKRNLQSQGGGVFQILRMGNNTASFLFRGWGNTYTSPLHETIYVQADGNTDIRHAVIRKMISIIRQRQTGDFTWESMRLGRVVTLSARPEDNAGLEDFLMSEFFGTDLKPSAQ
jgi:hypothetical protein